MLRTPPIALLLLLATAGCGSAAPTRPAGQPPTPASVTRANPGGDAADPELAALERLLNEPWGRRRDRYNTLQVPLVDWKKWRRVRIWSHPTRATYRYGDDHYAAATILYTEAAGRDDPDTCLNEFWQRSMPIADAYGVRVGDTQLFRTTQEIDGDTRPMVIKIAEGSIESVFESDDYVGAVAAYQSWPGTCLVHAFAVKSGAHRDIALKVRERWITEGAPKLRWHKRITDTPETKAR